MPYHLTLRTPNLLCATLHGSLYPEVANAFCHDSWQLLDGCPKPTHLLIDGREVRRIDDMTRHRAEQVVRHPHVGCITIVIRQNYLPLLAPIVQHTSRFRVFTTVQKAMTFLRAVPQRTPGRIADPLEHQIAALSSAAVPPASLA